MNSMPRLRRARPPVVSDVCSDAQAFLTCQTVVERGSYFTRALILPCHGGCVSMWPLRHRLVNCWPCGLYVAARMHSTPDPWDLLSARALMDGGSDGPHGSLNVLQDVYVMP